MTPNLNGLGMLLAQSHWARPQAGKTKLLVEVIIMDAMLLESVEGLGHSPFVTGPGEIWESLQAEREQISRDLLSEGRLCECDATGLLESEASEEYTREIGWRHLSQLEARLRDITEAQDRLMDATVAAPSVQEKLRVNV